MFSPVRCEIKGTRAKKKKKSVINSAFAFVCLTLVGWSVVSMAMISGNNAGQPSRNWGWKL